jgi:hypothetical protein
MSAKAYTRDNCPSPDRLTGNSRMELETGEPSLPRNPAPFSPHHRNNLPRQCHLPANFAGKQSSTFRSLGATANCLVKQWRQQANGIRDGSWYLNFYPAYGETGKHHIYGFNHCAEFHNVVASGLHRNDRAEEFACSRQF